MLVIVGTDKTQQLIEWVTEKPGRTIFCANLKDALKLREEYDLSLTQVSWPRRLANYGNEVAIDNAETLLQKIIGRTGDLKLVALAGETDKPSK